MQSLNSLRYLYRSPSQGAPPQSCLQCHRRAAVLSRAWSAGKAQAWVNTWEGWEAGETAGAGLLAAGLGVDSRVGLEAAGLAGVGPPAEDCTST